MFLRTAILPETKLVGKYTSASLIEPNSVELWSGFMPRLNEISNRVSANLFSVQVFGPGYFSNFSPSTIFVKWAAAEVNSFDDVPKEFGKLTLPKGLYAVFLHKGPPAEFSKTARYIYSEWMPSSGYELDDRPHLEILGEKYSRSSENSEEEVWIPIRNPS